MQQGFCKFYPIFPARLYDLITPLILILHPRVLFIEKWMKLILLHQYHTKVKKNLRRHLSLWLKRRRIPMKTTFDFNFSNIMDTHKHGNKEKLLFVYLLTCNFEKSLLEIKNKKLEKLSSLYWYKCRPLKETYEYKNKLNLLAYRKTG